MRRRTRTAWVLAAAVVLAATGGVAGAVVPPTVLVDGDPLVHTFALDRPGDAVTGEWRVSTTGAATVPFDGVLTAEAPAAATLAGALAVEYGRTGADGRVLGWHAAGTLADPVAYGTALGAEPRVRPGEPVVVPVRVSLPDPAAVTGAPGETLVVRASFVVGWLDDGAPGGPPGGAPDAGHPVHGGRTALAGTGAAVGAVALGAAALLVAGTALARGRAGRAEGARER
ncbi:hypothetical protein [Cellulomonas sp. Y8]|uniref:hypothetical protein n=1 Tax=Cellulomonas sp. Y8 TaxID=2591145 RepID=UPI003D747C2D